MYPSLSLSLSLSLCLSFSPANFLLFVWLSHWPFPVAASRPHTLRAYFTLAPIYLLPSWLSMSLSKPVKLFKQKFYDVREQMYSFVGKKNAVWNHIARFGRLYIFSFTRDRSLAIAIHNTFGHEGFSPCRIKTKKLTRKCVYLWEMCVCVREIYMYMVNVNIYNCVYESENDATSKKACKKWMYE